MGLFRKKPIPVTAVQWFPGKDVPGVEIHQPPDVGISDKRGNIEYHKQNSYPVVHTREGTVRPSPGSWICCGNDGEYWPIQDKIFRATYEPLDEASEKELLENPPIEGQTHNAV